MKVVQCIDAILDIPVLSDTEKTTGICRKSVTSNRNTFAQVEHKFF
jgi:hypothetical protein